VVHVSGVPLDTTYPPTHIGTHVAPDTMGLPSPHAAEFVTLGSAQGFGAHVNVAGVSTPAKHPSPPPPTTTLLYPTAHIGAHIAPDATVPPAPHMVEFATVGNAQASGEHDGGIPLHVPATSHV